MINIVIIFTQNNTKRELRALSIFGLNTDGASKGLDDLFGDDEA